MARWPTSPIDIERVRHPGERAARNIMMIAALPMLLVIVIYILFTLGTLLILIGMVVAFLMFMEALWLASIRANGMRVSSRQYPELNAMVENFSSRLGLKQPEVYIMQQSAWNAFATKLLRTRVVVLLSGAVDALLLDGNDDGWPSWLAMSWATTPLDIWIRSIAPCASDRGFPSWRRGIDAAWS